MTYHNLGNIAFTQGSTAGGSMDMMSTSGSKATQNMSAIQPKNSMADRSPSMRSPVVAMGPGNSVSDNNMDNMSMVTQETVTHRVGYPMMVQLGPDTTERSSMNMSITSAAQNIAANRNYVPVSQGALNTYLRQKAQEDAEKAAESKKAAMLSAGNTLRILPGFTYTNSGSGSNRVVNPEVDPGSLTSTAPPCQPWPSCGATSTAPPCQPWPSCGQGHPALAEEEPLYKHPAVIGGGIILLLAAGYAIYKSQGG